MSPYKAGNEPCADTLWLFSFFKNQATSNHSGPISGKKLLTRVFWVKIMTTQFQSVPFWLTETHFANFTCLGAPRQRSISLAGNVLSLTLDEWGERFLCRRRVKAWRDCNPEAFAFSLSPHLPVQELHDHHRVLRKKPIWRGRGCLHRLQDPVVIRLLQPGGPCLTCSTATSQSLGPPALPHLSLRTWRARRHRAPPANPLDSLPFHVSPTLPWHSCTFGRSRELAHTRVSVLCFFVIYLFLFNPFNHGKCSAGLSDLTGVVGVGVPVTVQLNAVQVAHYPKHCRWKKSKWTNQHQSTRHSLTIEGPLATQLCFKNIT